MGLHGFSWVFMGLHGSSWVFMGLHGSSWGFMGFHGSSCEFMGFLVPFLFLVSNSFWSVSFHRPAVLPFLGLNSFPKKLLV